MCSCITGALAANAVFKGVGVGDDTATAVAATTSFIVRDGLAQISTIIFAKLKGSRMDSDCKKYRMRCDALYDFTLSINLASPFVPMVYRNILYCLSAILSAVIGVIANCYGTVIALHHARSENVSDLQVKLKYYNYNSSCKL